MTKPSYPSDDSSDPSAERRRAMVAVGAVTDRLTRPLLGKQGLAEGALLAHWETIVGIDLAAFALPERVHFPRGRRDGGEVTVRVGSGPAAVQLQHDAPRVIERINGYFGYPAVARLKIVQAPLPVRRDPRPPDPPPLNGAEAASVARAVAAVADPDLRAALERLGHAVRRRHR